MFYVATADATGCGGSGCQYTAGIYNESGTLLAQIAPQQLTSTGDKDFPIAGEASVRLNPGKYYFALTGTGTVAALSTAGSSTFLQFCANTQIGNSTAGVLPNSVAPPADSYTIAGTYAHFALR
jgi:hypothetical protein